MRDDRHLDVSWAQHWEDVRLWRVLHDRAPGFYADVGAMDDVEDSVTHAFYERGWSGIDVEPNPDCASRLRAGRDRDVIVEAAAGRSPGRATLHVVRTQEGTGLSTVMDELAAQHAAAGRQIEDVEVDVVAVADLLRGTAAEDPARYHFLKVDAEGAEADVLAGSGLDRYRPLVVVLEARTPDVGAPAFEPSEAILFEAGYVFAADDGLNRWYVRSEDRAVAELLAPEINPLTDGYPRKRVFADVLALADRLEDRLKESERRLVEISAGYEEALARLAVLSAEHEEALARVAVLSAEHEEALARVDALQGWASALEMQVDQMVSSLSWRITSPFRVAGRAVARRWPFG